VLPYVGDLTQIMTQVKSLLEAGGLFGFTVETHAGAGIRLGEKLRYAHSEMLVRDAIASVGLALHVFEHASTRNEGGAPVANVVVLGGRP
jgi:predicted TPR repeat methyltransferase